MKSISVIIPVHNEEHSISGLHKELCSVLPTLSLPFEIIFVDDASTDATPRNILETSPVTMVRLRTKSGQTAAIHAGVGVSKGDIIVTMDGDGQDDPKEIPKLIKKIEEGFDVVSGWRKHRNDSLGKRIISRTAHGLRTVFVRDGIHDSGSGLKAFTRECFSHIELYGEIHRFLIGMLKAQGFVVGEVIVTHRPRMYGKTKYGLSRTFKGFIDMIGVWFWRSFATRPMYFFGGCGLLIGGTGGLIIGTLFVLRVFSVISLSGSIWPLASFFLVLVGFQLFGFGILADFSMKNFHKTRGTHGYIVRDIINR